MSLTVRIIYNNYIKFTLKRLNLLNLVYVCSIMIHTSHKYLELPLNIDVALKIQNISRKEFA